MKSRFIIGLMSGTSVDGIDAALLEITGRAPRLKARLVEHVEVSWPKALRTRLLAIMAPAVTRTEELCDLEFEVAREFARAVAALLKKTGHPASRITALGCHGQTICHRPPQGKSKTASRFGSTLQIGDPSVLATLSGIPCVGNFRVADMALGGQGAPLVPWTDAVLLSDPKLARCIQNIGGIANVTFLPPAPKAPHFESVQAFDTGPGNMLIDALIQQVSQGAESFDRDGRLAANGRVDEDLLHRLMKMSYFRQKPPKSTGRELFGAALAQKLLEGYIDQRFVDLVATATELTAWSIADAYQHFISQPVDEVIVCGGGASNKTLLKRLDAYLQMVWPGRWPQVRVIDELGWTNKAKEAASFALLAAAHLDRVGANLIQVTGASRGTILGSYSPVLA